MGLMVTVVACWHGPSGCGGLGGEAGLRLPAGQAGAAPSLASGHQEWFQCIQTGGRGVGGENEGGLRALPFGRKAKRGESETERAGSPVQAGAQGGSRKLCRQRLRGARPLKCRATDRGSRTTERAVCHDPPRDPPPGAFAPGPALQARPSAPRRAQGSEGRVSLSRLSVGTAFRCLLLSRLSTRQSEFVFLATSVPR